MSVQDIQRLPPTGSTDPATIDRECYVFVCAPGHSGSTLFDMVLGAHSRGFSLGEITHLPKNIALDTVCGCGHHISECEFWTGIIMDMSALLETDLWRDPYALNLGYIRASKVIDSQHQTRVRMLERKIRYAVDFAFRSRGVQSPSLVNGPMKQAAANKVALYQSVWRHVFADELRGVIVDSSKHYLEALYLHEMAPQQTKIFVLVRDGRAVFNSGLKQGFSRECALDAWYNSLRRCLHLFEKQLPKENWLVVSYEKLACDPQGEFQRVCEFLGLEFESTMLTFKGGQNHITNGNNMRFKSDDQIALDQNWLNELTPEDLSFFESHAGEFNRRLGYTGSDSVSGSANE